jgi:hypothetical protein
VLLEPGVHAHTAEDASPNRVHVHLHAALEDNDVLALRAALEAYVDPMQHQLFYQRHSYARTHVLQAEADEARAEVWIGQWTIDTAATQSTAWRLYFLDRETGQAATRVFDRVQGHTLVAVEQTALTLHTLLDAIAAGQNIGRDAQTVRSELGIFPEAPSPPPTPSVVLTTSAAPPAATPKAHWELSVRRR